MLQAGLFDEAESAVNIAVTTKTRRPKIKNDTPNLSALGEPNLNVSNKTAAGTKSEANEANAHIPIR